MTHLVTFAHISDTHLHADRTHTGDRITYTAYDSARMVIDYLNTLDADIDFVLHTGDVAHNPDDETHYQEARSLLQTLRYPVYTIPGNHDRVQLFQETFCNCPPYAMTPHVDYEFRINGVQFIMLDSHASADIEMGHGLLTSQQLAWLRTICESDETCPLVVGVHHNALPTGAPWLDRIMLKNGQEMHEALLPARERLRGVFFGHIHESLVTVRDGISYYSVQSAWYQTRTWYNQQEPANDPVDQPGFNLVTLTQDTTYVRFFRVQR